MTRAHTPRSSTTGNIAASKCWNDGVGLLVRLRQRDPALDAVHALAAAAHLRRRALGMGDAAPRRHQVHGAGRDLERIALAVAMHDAAVEQIGDGGKPDMRMRPHVHALPGDELHRAHLVEEDERADHLALAVRQGAAHLEAAEVAGARHDRRARARRRNACRRARGRSSGIQLMAVLPCGAKGALHIVIWPQGGRMGRPAACRLPRLSAACRCASPRSHAGTVALFRERHGRA